MPSELEVIKNLLDEQGKAIEGLRAKNDKVETDKNKPAGADVLDVAERDRLNNTISELQSEITARKTAHDDLAARIEELENAEARPKGLAGTETRDSTKARERRSAFFNAMRSDTGRMSAEDREAIARGYAEAGLVREGRQLSALVEDASGEILVPEDLEREIKRAIPEVVIIRNLASHRDTTSDRVRRRSLTELSVGWGKIELGDALTESDTDPGEEYIYVEDLYGLTKIGEDELMDSDVALGGFVSDSFTRAIGETEDTGFVVGTGHANKQPEGMLNGAVLARINAGQAAAITADDLIALEYAIKAAIRKNGVYLVASSTEKAMRLLKDANDQYLWQPSLQAGKPTTFNNRPVYNQEDIPAIPAAGTAADVAIFGDVRLGYQVVDRIGVMMKRLNELFATAGKVGFLVHRRTTGAVVEAEALKVLKVPAA